jgi:hypothetical protein
VVNVTLVSLEGPADVRTFEKGRFEVYRIGPMVIGRASYGPGWVWSEHAGKAQGKRRCEVEHVRRKLSGSAVAKLEDGGEVTISAGQSFYVPPGHDSWAVGDEAYVSLHILGSET